MPESGWSYRSLKRRHAIRSILAAFATTLVLRKTHPNGRPRHIGLDIGLFEIRRVRDMAWCGT
eukprot:4876463-Lingulodinium_polyedra.AAC.1